MSGICGIVNLDGEPVSACNLSLINSTLSHLGSDGADIWIDGAAGFGHQMMHTTPESLYESLPFHDSPSDLSITADARLDNRDYLFQTLNISSAVQKDCADSFLILKAYEKWSDNCAEHLLGDFAFVIWDRRNRRLFCCRDHMGVRSLFYNFDGERFIFASEAKGILACPGIQRELDTKRLALITMTGYFLVDNESSFYRNIHILPPATTLIVEKGKIRKQNYWEPNPVTTLPFKKDDEILDAFRTLMFDAVRVRLRSSKPVMALLSGGLDSSAVVSVAAKQLEEQSQRLTTLSAIVPNNRRERIPDERRFVDEFLSWPNIDLTYITDPDGGPFDNVEELVKGYESPVATSRHYLYTAFANAAVDNGSRVILDGQFGELGPTFHGDGYYAELLLHFRWSTLFGELKRKRKSSGLSIRAELLRDLVPGIFRRKDRTAKWRSMSPLLHDFVTRETNELMPKLRSAERVVNRTVPNLRRNHHSRVLMVSRKSRGMGGFVGYEKIEVRYPFLDKRILEFCLGVPGNLMVRDGYKRHLIRAGLDGILPPAIQWRTSKLAFSPDYQDRYNTQRKHAHSFLESISATDPVRDVVDIERLKSLAINDMANSRAKTFDDFAAMHLVPLGIYTIVFLRQFSEFRKS